jgi:hypothetical protein
MNSAMRSCFEQEAFMAVNKPTGDKARKKGGQFMAVKKSAKKFKGVRREK